MKNLLTRTLTGVLYLVVFIGALIIGKYTFAALFLVISLIALWEFYSIVDLMGHKPMRYLGILIGTVLFLLVFYICSWNKSLSVILFIIPVIIAALVLELYRNQADPIANIALMLFGVIYVSLPLTLFNGLAFYDNQEYTYRIILGFFILLWINDISAYLFGISIGKHRLFERISPKKSWEGFFGGTVITIIAAYLIGNPFFLLTRTNWVMIGLIISVAGVFGDLLESLFKRAAELKDSGRILPGHGGMLDRIDSVLLSAPLVFAYLMLINLF